MFTPTALPVAEAATLVTTLFDGPERTVPKGTRIFCPGDPSHSLFLLRRGLVKLSTLTPKGEEITLRVYRPADIFGEGCLSRPVQRYWATALERSEVIEASIERALEALAQSPELAIEFLSGMTDRLAAAYDELQTVASRIAVIRVAARLAAFPGTDLPEGGWVQLSNRFTHEELAQIVGIRRETLTRALSRLKQLHLVECAAGRPMRIHRGGLEALLTTSRSPER
jgi:CRP-like cAMP-binding protein